MQLDTFILRDWQILKKKNQKDYTLPFCGWPNLKSYDQNLRTWVLPEPTLKQLDGVNADVCIY